MNAKNRPSPVAEKRAPRVRLLYLTAALALAWITAAALVQRSQASADEPALYKPRKVEITPNALQAPDKPMRVSIVANNPGQTMYLFILKSCDDDPSTPEIVPRDGCDPVLWRDQVHMKERFHRLPLDVGKLRDKNGEPLPGNVPLWVRVSATSDGIRAKRDAMFSVSEHPCDAWRTMLAVFGRRGPCHAGVRATFMPMRGIIDELPQDILEVRFMDMDRYRGGDASSVVSILPRTHGATGVSWLDDTTLVVTRRALEELEKDGDLYTGIDHGDPKATPWDKAGTYLFDLKTGARELLHEALIYTIPNAPFAASRDLVVWAEDDIVPRPEDKSTTTLMVWRRGKGVTRLPIERTLHQILGVHRSGGAALAYSLFQRRPKLVYVCLRTGRIIDLGSDHRMLHALMHSPRDARAVLALENNADKVDGWELIFVDNTGVMTDKALVGPGHDLLPAWRPDGSQLAYIGQVQR